MMVDGDLARQNDEMSKRGSQVPDETRGSVLNQPHIGKKEDASRELVYNEHI